jgi:hypothetical protein
MASSVGATAMPSGVIRFRIQMGELLLVVALSLSSVIDVASVLLNCVMVMVLICLYLLCVLNVVYCCLCIAAANCPRLPTDIHASHL